MPVGGQQSAREGEVFAVRKRPNGYHSGQVSTAGDKEQVAKGRFRGDVGRYVVVRGQTESHRAREDGSSWNGVV
jgi:hypothetical protein